MGAKIHKHEHDGNVTYMFQCPACNTHHSLNDTWQFNGSYDYPTFMPSILVTAPHRNLRCHSYIGDGRIKFLDDCSHDMAGRLAELPDWNETQESDNE